jgi:hypothetical protein
MPGKHICYPILVHKFLITDGQHKGEQLNALASISPADLAYFPGEQEGELKGEHKGQHVTPQKRLKTIEGRREKKQTPRFALPEWVPQPAWDDFLDMRISLGAKPTEKAKALLVRRLEKLKDSGQNPQDVLEQSIERSWRGVFPLKQESVQGKERRNGKPTVGDAARITLEAMRATEEKLPS